MVTPPANVRYVVNRFIGGIDRGHAKELKYSDISISVHVPDALHKKPHQYGCLDVCFKEKMSPQNPVLGRYPLPISMCSCFLTGIDLISYPSSYVFC